MLAKAMITETITPLKTSDSGTTALGLMEEFRVSHLPIVNDLELLGVISDTDILNMTNIDDPVGSCPLSVTGAYVQEGDHIYEVIKTFSEHHLTLLPVVNDKNHYMGVITMMTLDGSSPASRLLTIRAGSLYWRSTRRITRSRKLPRSSNPTMPRCSACTSTPYPIRPSWRSP